MNEKEYPQHYLIIELDNELYLQFICGLCYNSRIKLRDQLEGRLRDQMFSGLIEQLRDQLDKDCKQ